MPMIQRHSFAIADLGGLRVAIEAAALTSVEAPGDASEPLDVSELLELPLSRIPARHVLRAGQDGEEVGLAVTSVTLRDFEIDKLHKPPGLIVQAMNRIGLLALLDLGGDEWAFVLDVAALARAAEEIGL